jgi:hypothetical protein
MRMMRYERACHPADGAVDDDDDEEEEKEKEEEAD